jgi:hypothetical protein
MASKPDPVDNHPRPIPPPPTGPVPPAAAAADPGAGPVLPEEPPSYSGLYNEPPPLYYSGEMPPAYQVAASLPTYEEAEMSKGD